MDEEKGGFFARFKYFSGKVIPALKDLIDNEEFRSRLDKAGGMISLIAIGLEMYDSIQKNLKTDEDRACNSLIRIVFATTQDLLNETSKKYLDGQEIEIDMNGDRKKNILQSLVKSFEEYSDQDSFSYLSSHPLITTFKSSVISQLKERYQNSNEQIITHFEEKFEPLFETRIEDDINIQIIDELIERMIWYKERKKYLNYVIKKCEKDSVKDLEKEPLDGHYYIENREALLADTSEWNYTDKEILGKYPNIHKDDAEKIIDKFLRDSIAWRELFVGAPFGMGKTTLVKKIASKYAKESLESSIQYIPIIVFLKEGLYNIYLNLDLYDVFDNIIAPDKDRNEKAFNRKILLILDGLDDYEDEADQDVKRLMEKIKTDFRKYRNLKVIVTTRLKDEIPAKLHIGEKYLRLLPFSMQQLKDFFEHYDIKLSHDELQDISPGLAEEITNPLLAWMFSNIYPLIQDRLQEIIKSNDKLTGNMAKSLIYLNFFHYIIRGQYALPLEEEKYKLYFYEKKMLRALAVLKQIYGDKLTEEKVNQSQEIVGCSIDTSKFDKILDSYFYVKPDNNYEKIINFVHKTFKEYLLAEYYVGCLLDKISWMNIGIPSKETVEFLGGLFELLNTDNQKIRKFIESNIENGISLVNSFKPTIDDDVKEKIIETSIKSIDDVKEKIIETSIKSINQEQKIFNSPLNNDEKNEGDVTTISIDTYENLSIPGWISLFALDILAPGLYPRNNEDKEKLVKLIRHPSNNVPAELKKLKKVDLSNAYLADVNLADVDLSGADFSKTNLSNINLSGANLSAAKLLKADLSDARLHKTNLSKADLSDATLRYANLSKADLRGAILRYADLSNATVSEADLTEAKIENAILSRINLFKANLSKANLTHANLSLCDLTHANLTEAILTNTRLFSATLFKANLSKAKLSNAYLARSTLTDANLTEATIDSADFLSTNLSYADISNCKLHSAKIRGRLTYYGLRCMKADFNKAIVENKELIDYLQKNGAANVIKSEQTPEEDKTNERQENIKSDLTETSDQVETKNIGLKLLQSAEQEIFITFSGSNEVNNIEDEDVIQIINEGENHARIRIQSPVKELIVERHLKNSIV